MSLEERLKAVLEEDDNLVVYYDAYGKCWCAAWYERECHYAATYTAGSLLELVGKIERKDDA